jgi:hypothetical protein
MVTSEGGGGGAFSAAGGLEDFFPGGRDLGACASRIGTAATRLMITARSPKRTARVSPPPGG